MAINDSEYIYFCMVTALTGNNANCAGCQLSFYMTSLQLLFSAR